MREPGYGNARSEATAEAVASSETGRESLPADALIARLDEIRAALADAASEMPAGDARTLLLAAKQEIAMAQDLLEAEYA